MIFLPDHRPSVERRFMEKAVPEPASGCWLWAGSVTNRGYGEIMLRHVRRTALAHRVAYELFKGEIPAGMQVLHRCDLPCCVNPDHLRLGTAVDNMADMHARRRNRQPKGERHPLVKISAADVVLIRADSRSSRKVAADFGISHTQVLHIRRGRSWAHLETAK